MRDIHSPGIVEIEIREDGKVIWVNTEAGCILRICRVKAFRLLDHRSKDTKLSQAFPHSRTKEERMI